MQENIDSTNNYFSDFNLECVSKIINNFDTSKTTQQDGFPTKMIKDNKGIFDILSLQAWTMDVFPEKMKHADIKPFYKKESRNKKENYRRVNILRNLSKSFECCIYDQLNDYFDKMLSKCQRGFGKGFSIQQY